jgi:GTPase SAR1 family protein
VAHVLIVGTTESGKTTLARNLSTHYWDNNYGVLVLDPLGDPRWSADFITDDQEEFLDVFWRSRRCVAFMDEGGESVGRYDLAMQQTATRGRHWGHSCHYVCQDPTQLAPIVRAQCSHLFAFALSSRQSKIMAEEFNEPLLETCTRLRQGEYIHAQRFGKTSRHTSGVIENASIDSDRNDRRRQRVDSAGTETRQENGEENSGTNRSSVAVSGASSDTDHAGGSDTGADA